jgi:hypothetical protein
MAWNLWTFSALCLTAWWIGAAGMLRWRRRLIAALDGQKPGQFLWFNRAALLLYFAPALFLLPVHLATAATPGKHGQSLLGSGFDSWFRATIFYALPLALSSVTLAFLEGRQRLPGLKEPARRDALYIALSVTPLAAMIAFLVALWLADLTNIPSFDLFLILLTVCAAAIAGAIGARKRLDRAKAGKPLEMDESPLRDEILRLATLAGAPVESVKVATLRVEKLGEASRYEDFLRLYGWWRNFQPQKPVIPIDLIQQLPFDAISATLAVKYAHWEVMTGRASDRSASRVSAWLIQRKGLYFAGVVCAGAGIALMRTPLALPLLLVSVAAMLSFIAIFLIRRRRVNQTATTRRAWELWRDADPSAAPGERSEWAFLGGIAQWNRVLNRHMEREPLVRLLAVHHKGFSGFLDEVGRQQALAAMDAAIRAWEEQRG